MVVVHTDEPQLDRGTVADFLEGHSFARPAHIATAYLQLSYEPASGSCPYFELNYGA
jgi:hypothetical protein